MEQIIIAYESFVQPFINAWKDGGWIALLATVLASPVLMIFIRLFFAWLSGKSANRKARKRKAIADKAREAAEIEQLKAVVAKEFTPHENT